MRSLEGIYLRFGAAVDERVNDRVVAAAQSLSQGSTRARPAGITEIVPSYASIYIEYDRTVVSGRDVRRWIDERVRQEPPGGGAPGEHEVAQSHTFDLPVRYDGLDLEGVAEAAGVGIAEVVRRHAAVEYRVYAVGFTPGFPFMGSVDPVIRTPRLEIPRPRVEANTLAIADAQTGVYPLASPGGWRQLGTVLEAVYDPQRERPFLLSAGDRVRFAAVDTEGSRAANAPPTPRHKELLPPDPRHPAAIVREAGLLDLVVDAGRFGAGEFGLARSGPLDARSAGVANLLVGNPRDAPLLELNVRGPALEFVTELVVAFAGWGVTARLNDEDVPTFTSFAVRPGDRLEFPPSEVGVRGYLAFAGGLHSDRFMGSASVDVRGLIGRPLRQGDLLGIERPLVARPGYSFRPHARWPVEQRTALDPRSSVVLRLLHGPQADPEALAALKSAAFRVEHADRMGLQLVGPQVPGGGILSEANPLGAVQVTPSGQPLILLHDRGTIGGYTKPAIIHPHDLPLAGQLRTGDRLRFVT